MEERLIECLKIAMEFHVTDIHFHLKTYPKESLSIEMKIEQDVKQMVPKEDDIRLFRYLMYKANLDLSDIHHPQTGRFEMEIDGQPVSLRFALVSSYHNTSGVLRILNQHSPLHIEDLTVDYDTSIWLRNITKHTSGLFIFSGPTGSGKTTTLYTILNETKGKKIFTLEDPVEVRISGINQININSALGLDFATGLRAMLRQDFEVGLVGEMRDRETANIALRAGITGHLIFTTLHTADTVSTIIRLLNLGIENYVISSGVIAILSQRLVRKLCPKCKIKRDLTNFEKEIFKKNNLETPEYIYEKCGCEHCNRGYIGRTLILESLILDDEIKEIINGNCNSVRLYEYFKKNGNESLYKNGLRKIADGITSFEEVNKILFSLGEF